MIAIFSLSVYVIPGKIYGLYHTGTIDMRRWSAGQLSRVERFIDRKDSRIMDYGTGPGFTYKALVDKGYTNVRKFAFPLFLSMNLFDTSLV